MKKRLFLASLFIAIVAMLGAAYLWLSATPEADYNPPTAHTVIELHPDTTPIWAERHHITADGKKSKTDVLFRNGETGTRFYREDQSLSKEIIRFADGRERMYAEFAADGKQVVTGRMLRDDGTTVWLAVRDASDIVTTTRYWYDGGVFSTERRKVGATLVEREFFYRSGAKWMHFRGVHDGSLLPDVETIWNEDGTLKFSHLKGLNETSTSSVYRSDGTLHFKQLFVMEPYSYYYPGMTPQPPRMRQVMTKVEVYDAGGTRVVRDFIMNSAGWYIERAVDHNPDGSTIHWDTVYDGTAYQKTTIDQNGRTISVESLRGRNPPKFTVDDAFKQNYLNQLNPLLVWQELEANPDRRP